MVVMSQLNPGDSMADDKRWMIRGVDKTLRKAIKETAKAEGVSIGSWVRRALERSLEEDAATPRGRDVGARLAALESRITALERARATAGRRPAADTGDKRAAKEHKR